LRGARLDLGIRTAAMAIRAWNALRMRPVFRFGGLDLVARSLGHSKIKVIADARRGAWHCQTLGEPIRRVVTADLEGDLVTPTSFRSWSPLPVGITSTPYLVETMLKRTAAERLFRSTAEPEAFLHDEPTYATWQPHVHRNPNT